MNTHKQVEITIFNKDGKDKKIKVDEKLSKIIFYLNNHYGLKTEYSCQGNRENAGYIKFDDDVDLEKALDILEILMPKHVIIMDRSQCVRFFSTEKAWVNYYKFLKNIQNIRNKSFNLKKTKKE